MSKIDSKLDTAEVSASFLEPTVGHREREILLTPRSSEQETKRGYFTTAHKMPEQKCRGAAFGGPSPTGRGSDSRSLVSMIEGQKLW